MEETHEEKQIGGSSISRRLLRNFSIAILIPSVIIFVAGIRIINHRVLREAQAQVVSDLKMAREIYNANLERLRDNLRLTAENSSIRELVVHGERETLVAMLERLLREEGLDLLMVTDAGGKVLARGNNPQSYGDDQSHNQMIAAVLAAQRPLFGTQLIQEKQLKNEGLFERVRMEIIATPRARPQKFGTLTMGMMLSAAVPLVDENNKFLGTLYGGKLLNRNYEIVDKIKETVFGQEVGGTATIFQDEVRVATNVRRKDGERAVGTRVSSEVYEAVVEKGGKWIARAFVVNDWYITAYEPLYDIAGKIVGILYVGILKRPYTILLWRNMFVFFGATLIGILIVVFVSLHATRYISRPLMKMADVAHRIAQGDYNQRIDIRSSDEIGYLAESFNLMTERLLAAQRSLEEWGRQLEQKVKERTVEIKRMERQLCQSEKLAALGKLAAGVAHEINNPLTAVLTNASLMMEDLAEDDPQREDLDTMVRETIRCRKIVRGLLDFARQTEPEKKPTDINNLVENTLELLQNQLALNAIEVEKQLGRDLPLIKVDADQVQQVFLNITMNAIEAMNGGGKLSLRSRVEGEKFVAVSISDTGVGIRMEDVRHLFDPFFTTKTQGTGLGLAISYGIVQRHGGDIRVHSHMHKGSTFTILLPIESKGSDDEAES